MPLVYSFVARQPSTVLAEYTPFHGNFSTVALECLQHLQPGRAKGRAALPGWVFTSSWHEPELYIQSRPPCTDNCRVIHADQAKLTITCDKHTFNFLRRDEFVFLVVADEAFGRQIPFAFLDRISEDFTAKFASKGKTAGAHGMDRSVGPLLKQHMVRRQQYRLLRLVACSPTSVQDASCSCLIS